MAGRKPRTPAWQLQTAKARFSEVFRLARSRQPKSLVSFFRESPLASTGIDLERAVDYGRSVQL